MKAKGFTLVEMILTMIVSSILVLGITGFVELGSQGYADSAARQRLQTQGRFILEKMSREIQSAVPNSFTIFNNSEQQQCLSFYPIHYSGFYALEDDDRQLSFLIGNTNSVVDLSGLSLIINPTNPIEFKDKNSNNIALTGSSTTITLATPLLSQSIAERFYIYKESITYCLDLTHQMMTRNGEQIADSIVNGSFSYETPSFQQGGIVHLSMVFEQNDEQNHIQQDVQVLNVP